MAALEGEAWLAEQEDVDVPNGIEQTEAKKDQANGAAPEYRANPLL